MRTVRYYWNKIPGGVQVGCVGQSVKHSVQNYKRCYLCSVKNDNEKLGS